MFFLQQIHFLRIILRRPHTDSIPEGAPKMFLRNRNHDSCEKSATGAENTGILRIPAGITNLAPEETTIVRPPSGDPDSDPQEYWLLLKTLYGLHRSPRHWSKSMLFLSLLVLPLLWKTLSFTRELR